LERRACGRAGVMMMPADDADTDDEVVSLFILHQQQQKDQNKKWKLKKRDI
jgi:predicted small lipoprotein YifL